MPGGANLNRAYTPPTFSAVDNFRNVTKWAATVNQGERVSELMRRAFHLMRNGKPGPVLLEVPGDMVDAEIRRARLRAAREASLRSRSGRHQACRRSAAQVHGAR